MAKIELNKGLFATIDDADLALVTGFRWKVCRKRHTWVARTSIRTDAGQRALYMSRLIMDAQGGQYVDHRNGDGLDNRRINLRVCTNAENCRNKNHVNSRNKSGAHGVFWERSCRRWRAKICKDYKTTHIGVYETIEEATAAYREASLRMHGEFASPLEGEVCHR